MARKAAQKMTARQAWLANFYSQECCGLPMKSGFDVMTYACRHTDYEQVMENAAYILCVVCGNGETLCAQCVDEAVIDAGHILAYRSGEMP